MSLAQQARAEPGDQALEAVLRRLVERIAAIERPSASEGERRAAELIAAELRAAGAGRVRLEEERVHGSFYWPIGLATGAAALAAASRSRALAAVAGTVSALAMWDDLRFGPRVLRKLLPRRTSCNVVGELGPERAERTIVFVSHHDAAHSGLVFDQSGVRALDRMFPGLIENRIDTSPPMLWGAFGGPLLVAAGALLGRRRPRAAGAVLSAGYAAAMADIGARRVVPGANDNATGCAAVVELARGFAAEPPPHTRLVFLSTGSEESFSEGMVAFVRRHSDGLARERTTFVALDSIGGPQLLALEGEGFLGVFEYPKDLLATVKTCADELGIRLKPNLRTRAGTDGLVPLMAGYPTVSIASCDRLKQIPNYHMPTDTPERVDYRQVADAVRLCRGLVQRLG
jgi:Peptidase family M28